MEKTGRRWRTHRLLAMRDFIEVQRNMVALSARMGPRIESRASRALGNGILSGCVKHVPDISSPKAGLLSVSVEMDLRISVFRFDATPVVCGTALSVMVVWQYFVFVVLNYKKQTLTPKTERHPGVGFYTRMLTRKGIGSYPIHFCNSWSVESLILSRVILLESTDICGWFLMPPNCFLRFWIDPSGRG